MDPVSGKKNFPGTTGSVTTGSVTIGPVTTAQQPTVSRTNTRLTADSHLDSNAGKQAPTSPGIRNDPDSARNVELCKLIQQPARRTDNVLAPDVILARLLSMAALPHSETGTESEDLPERLRHALMELAALDSCEAVGEILRIYPLHCTPPLLSQALARASHGAGNGRMIALLKAHGAEPGGAASAVVEPPVP